MSSSAQKPGGGSKVAANLDQVRNGGAGCETTNTCPDPPAWVNGNAGKTNAHYREGDSIAYRMVITGLRANTEHDLQIEWDIKHSGVNAIDYITHYNRSTNEPKPCLGISACDPTDFDTAPIPAPTPINSPKFLNGIPQPVASFNALPAEQRLMTIYNGTIEDSGLSYLSSGDLTAAQSSTRMNIHFTATGSTVVIAWGGHIGSRLDWGFTDGIPNSAGGISGSPYHTRLISIDGGGGNQDRSLSADAVLPPADCELTGDGNVCAGATVTYTGSAGNDSYSWTLNDTGATGSKFANGQTTFSSTSTNTVDVVAGSNPGNYTVSLVVMKAGASQSTCPITSTVRVPPQVSVSLVNGCDATVSLQASISNAEANVVYGYVWSGPGVNGATTSSVVPTAPGTYMVTVTHPNNPNVCSTGTASKTLCFTVQE